MNFSNEIKAVRTNSLLSQVEFAKAIDVSFSTVNRWENGKATPNFQTIKRIRDFCNTNNLDFLIDVSKLKG